MGRVKRDQDFWNVATKVEDFAGEENELVGEFEREKI